MVVVESQVFPPRHPTIQVTLQVTKHVSSSKLRRDFARCWSNRRRLSSFSGHAQSPRGWSIEEALQAVLKRKANSFVAYYHTWREASSPEHMAGRQRDLFPLPPMRTWPLEVSGLPVHEVGLVLGNLCLAALNMLAADMRPGFWLGQTQRPTAPQKAVQQHIARRCACFLQKLQSRDAPNFGSCGSFQHFESKPSMQAEKVDLPARAATCDPEKLLPPELADSVMDVEKMFPFCMPVQPGPVGPEGAERAEYVKLVFRQLQCGKTLLRLQCEAIGDVFCVAKSHGKQREVWNGSLISQVAARPPGPAKLANPSCFVDLCFKPGEQVYDVQTFFDVLQAPQHLQKWFGRPPVSLHELARICAVSFDKLLEYVACEDRVDISPFAPLYPTSTVWPMGFSWSSCVAQACTIACCSKAGVQDNAFMTLDCPPPVGAEVCGVATDDTFFFHKDKLLGTERLEQLDRVLDEQGMPKNAAKDVTLESEMTALGCELTAQPPAAEPSTAKLAQLYEALLDVFLLGKASPTAVNRALGVEQWFCLLNRPMFSIFDAVYEFVRREPAGHVQTLPHKVLTELLIAACLSPLLGADLGRDFLARLIACDASAAHGFGVSYMHCPTSLVEEVSLLSERRGDFVRFFSRMANPVPKTGLDHLTCCLFTSGNFALRFAQEPNGGPIPAFWKLMLCTWL